MDLALKTLNGWYALKTNQSKPKKPYVALPEAI